MADFFNTNASRSYDEKNLALTPIAENMHFLVRLILKDLPEASRVLCVGVGTGAEILSLAKEYPGYAFVGVDPSEAMLEVCRERMEKAGILDRCELIHGYVEDVPADEPFDAVLSILVGHFVKREDRLSFYQGMHRRLKDGGYFIDTEISFDLDSDEFPSMFAQWSKVQVLMGATPESLATLPKALTDVLTVLPPSEVEDVMRTSGFRLPVRFFQSFMIAGWYAKKESVEQMELAALY